MAPDDNVLRPRPKSTILDGLNRSPVRKPVLEPEADGHAAPELPAADRVTPLPQPGSPYDVAHARPENKPVPMLRFIYGDTVRGLPYANLDSIDLVPADKPGGGPVIVKCVSTGSRRARRKSPAGTWSCSMTCCRITGWAGFANCPRGGISRMARQR